MIDDDPIVADTLAMVLNMSGFDATAVYSGESAVELARLTPFDKLVSDVLMEPMNGIQTALAISNLRPDCQVLLMSGNDCAGQMLQQARNAGHEFTILAKPVHPTTILDHLRAASPKLAAD